MALTLLIIALLMQALAVLYGFYLLNRRQGAASAWLFLLGAMLSMLAWRVVVVLQLPQPPYFNPAIAIWGSTCMLVAMFLFGREVERRKRLEGERDALLASERAARSEAERASRMKDEFLATISHELRTPLAAILSWCTVAKHPRATGDEKEHALETIERNARAQARLVDDLLDLTRLQAGALNVEFGEVALDAIVGSAVETVQPAAEAKAISVMLSIEQPLPRVHGDALRMQQVVGNLLVNAVKFTPQGGQIDVRLARSGDRAQLVITDNGEGIDADFLPQLFSRFRQADSTTSRRHGGLGLGLSIVASLVRLHGGEVTASSAGRGHGATFTVTLPVAEAGTSLAASGGNAAAAEPARPQALQGLRLLVVDDERDVREAVAAILERCGARVRTLPGPADVESALAEFQPHVLVMDISMPGEDGYSTIARIRRLPADRGGPIPAISLTAHARSEDRERALSAGFHEHLAKPIDHAGLIAAVRRLAVG